MPLSNMQLDILTNDIYSYIYSPKSQRVALKPNSRIRPQITLLVA